MRAPAFSKRVESARAVQETFTTEGACSSARNGTAIDASHYLLVSAGLSLEGQDIAASRERPYLAVRLVLDSAIITAVLIGAGLLASRADGAVRALAVSRLDGSLLDAVLRLVQSSTRRATWACWEGHPLDGATLEGQRRSLGAALALRLAETKKPASREAGSWRAAEDCGSNSWRARRVHSGLSEAMSMEKRYFTSDLSIRS